MARRRGLGAPAAPPFGPGQPAQIYAAEIRHVEGDEAQLLAVSEAAMQGGHRRGEAAGRQLPVENSAVPQDREESSEPPKSLLEAVTAQPVAPHASPVAGFKGAIRLKDDQAANAVDLRLDRPAIGVRDGG